MLISHQGNVLVLRVIIIWYDVILHAQCVRLSLGHFVEGVHCARELTRDTLQCFTGQLAPLFACLCIQPLLGLFGCFPTVLDFLDAPNKMNHWSFYVSLRFSDS